jgi:hypothetical protein
VYLELRLHTEEAIRLDAAVMEQTAVSGEQERPRLSSTVF